MKRGKINIKKRAEDRNPNSSTRGEMKNSLWEKKVNIRREGEKILCSITGQKRKNRRDKAALNNVEEREVS